MSKLYLAVTIAAAVVILVISLVALCRRYNILLRITLKLIGMEIDLKATRPGKK